MKTPGELKEVLSYVDSRAEEQIRFLVDMCDQNSHTHNKEGTDRVAGMILDRLGGILPEHQVVREAEMGDHHILRSAASPKAVYLVGHMDTVFPAGHPFQRCRPDGDVLVGPGCCDMKGGLAVLVYALKALEAAGLLPSLPITLILNADEEIGSVSSREIFEHERRRARICLVAECAGPSGEIVISRNGKLGARIDCHGTPCHVAAGSAGKSSAILELARRILSLESLNGCLPGATINVGRVEGGLGPSTVPGHASALADVRWTEEGHREILLQRIRETMDQPLQPGCRTEIAILNSRPAMPRMDGTDALYRDLVETGRRLGLEIGPEHRRGTSDANFFGSAGVPSLDGFGPVGGDDHTGTEWIRVSSLRERTALLAAFLAFLSWRSG
jgi:glutamate carboxypeptidase